MPATIYGPIGGSGGGAVGGVSTGGNTAGDTGTVSSQIVYVGGANITLSEGTAAGGLATVTIIGGAGGAGFQGGVSNLGNTSGVTKTVANMNVFAGGNNVTLSQATNAGGATITVSAGGVFISATDTSYRTGTVRFTGSNMVTVKSSGAGQTVIIDATQTVQTQNSVLVNGSSGAMSISASRNVSASNAAPNTVILYGPANILNSFSVGGNTGTTNSSAITGGGFVLAGGANVTLSQSNNTISIVGGAGAGAFQGGVSTGGNTSGDTKTVASQIVYVGGNNITLSQATNGASATITISGPSGGGAGMSTEGNTAGTTGTVGMELVFVGGSNITLSQSVNGSSGTLTIIGASGGSGAAPTFYHYPTVQVHALMMGAVQSIDSGSTSANGASTHSTMSYYVQPLAFDGNIVASDIMDYLKVTGTSQAGTASVTLRRYFGLYTLTSDSISLASSWMGGAMFTQSSDSYTLSAYTGSASNSFQSLSGTNFALFTGTKFGPIANGAATTFTAGQYFGVVALHKITTGGGLGWDFVYSTQSVNRVAVGATTTIWQPLNGAFSSSSSTNVAGANQWLMPPSVATNAISGGNYNFQIRPLIMFRGI